MLPRPQALTKPTVEIGSWPSKKKDQQRKFNRLSVWWKREHELVLTAQAGKYHTAHAQGCHYQGHYGRNYGRLTVITAVIVITVITVITTTVIYYCLLG